MAAFHKVTVNDKGKELSHWAVDRQDKDTRVREYTLNRFISTLRVQNILWVVSGYLQRRSFNLLIEVSNLADS